MPVTHDPDQSRFVLELWGTDEAFLLDQPLEADGQVAFTSVFVPDTHRGQGLAAQLADAAFQHARAAGWSVHPVCPYLRTAYLPRNPQHADVLA
ncbi:MAG: GNAT family N-acetyltransferase [Planctomycetota bacterium]